MFPAEDIRRAVEILIPLAALIYAVWRDQKKMHRENKQTLDAIVSDLRYLPPHSHQEQEGPLLAEGIIHKPNGTVTHK